MHPKLKKQHKKQTGKNKRNTKAVTVKAKRSVVALGSLALDLDVLRGLVCLEVLEDIDHLDNLPDFLDVAVDTCVVYMANDEISASKKNKIK